VGVSIGVITLVQGRALGARGMVAALAAGLLTAAYTVVDAGGMRASPGPFDFIVWFFLLLGAVLVAQFLVVRRRGAWALMLRDRRTGIYAGIMSLCSFGATLFALRYAPVGIVSGLRETCVLVSLGIGWHMLGESLTPRKMIAAFAITTGALTIIAGSAIGA
jgi:drug/metabolite transporter (DMT)-like permease